jgi:hypothetical protein
MLPTTSSAAKQDRAQGLRHTPTAHVGHRSMPCAQALQLGGCEQELRKVHRAYERFQRSCVDRFDDLEEAMRTLRSGEPQKASELIAGPPDWLYCVIHPFWCRRGL